MRLDDVLTDPRYGHSAPYHGMPEGHLPVRSYLAVPVITSEGEVAGGLFFGHPEPGMFSSDDERMVEGIAAQSAIAIENARLYQERTRTAQTLQRALLPPHLPQIAGLELAAGYRAAGEGNEVGGDFYDVFPQGDGSWVLVVGDVCGKGPQAAAVTALARYTLRAHAVAGLRPSYMLDPPQRRAAAPARARLRDRRARPRRAHRPAARTSTWPPPGTRIRCSRRAAAAPASARSARRSGSSSTPSCPRSSSSSAPATCSPSTPTA